MPQVLAASNACIATLLNIELFRTTYPNKVFDYMAAGRPIILGIDGVIREVVDASQGGIFVPPGDDAAMAEAILCLKNDPARAAAMGKCGRAYVEVHFDRRQQAAAFEQLLQSLLA
jgi:glycosyltransferase involved in cell wall biosynthesis